MSWSSTVSVAIFITCLAFFFEAVGFAIPFWVSTVYTYTNPSDNTDTAYSTHVSIWYVMSCISGKADSCKSEAIAPTFNSSANPTLTSFSGNSQEFIANLASTILSNWVVWSVLQIIATIGIGLTALATLVLVCCRCAGIHSHCWFISSLLILILADLVVLGITILGAIGYGYLFTFAPGSVTAETFPWSLLLFGLGGFFGVMARIGLCTIITKKPMFVENLVVLGITILGAIGYGYLFTFAPGSVTAETFPWSLLLFGLGGFFGVIAVIMLIVITCAWRKYGAYEENEEISLDDVPMSDRKHSERYGHDNPRYIDPHDTRKEYYEYDKVRKYDSRQSGKYNDYIDDYSRSGSGYRDGYTRDYTRDYRDPRDDRYYSGSRAYASDNMYRPYSQYRY